MRGAIALVGAGVFATGISWGTFAVGGSDSYCYVQQARQWASGTLQVVEPLAVEAPWPDAPATFAPAGHIASPTVRGAAAPICPAGLSLLMVPAVYVGAALGRPDAVFAVVPLFGALLVWAVYLVGSRFSPRVGLASALLVACSPAFLFQLMQPMSDVPAAALWVLATAVATGSHRKAPLFAGLLVSAAILVRPNLLPLGVVLGLWFVLESESGDGATQPLESPHHLTLTRVAVFAAASAPGCLAVALIQQTYYGSPLRSGYGPLDGLFAANHVVPNAMRYASWMSQVHTPVWVLAVVAPFFIPRRLTALLASLIVVNVACYLPYVVFNDWWYLRFLLPAIAFVFVLVVAVSDSLIHRVKSLRRRESFECTSRAWTAQWAIPLAILLSIVFVREARARRVFDLHRLEARYERAGAYVATRLPANALVITSWESGSVRFYGRRKTVVWDVLDPAWLDRAVAYVRERGYEPYLLFERWEEPIFRQRFAGSTVAALDWPPAAEIGNQVRIYRPDDRQRYLRGEAAPTEYAR